MVAPANAVVPAIGGFALPGQTLQAYPGGWTPAGVLFSYQWQRSADGVTWTSIGGATSSAYTVGAADGGEYLRVAVTAANVAGQSTATSAAVGPVPGSEGSAPLAEGGPPRWTARPQISADPGRVGDRLTLTAGRWTGSPLQADLTQVMRCTNTCVPVGSSNAGSYTITPADVGSVLWVKETVWNVAGIAVVWSARSAGPVGSTSAAAVVLAGGQIALRNSRGATLAFASIKSLSPSGELRRIRAGSRVLGLRRAPGVGGQLSAWVCRWRARPAARPSARHASRWRRARPCGCPRR